jgi:hypothetical protein
MELPRTRPKKMSMLGSSHCRNDEDVRKGILSSQSVSGSAFIAVDKSLARLLTPAADNPKSQSRNAEFPASNLAALPNLGKENRGTSGDLSCAQVL